MRIGSKGFEYHTVKVVLLANENRCEVDYNTLFSQIVKLYTHWLIKSIALSQLWSILTHVHICNLRTKCLMFTRKKRPTLKQTITLPGSACRQLGQGKTERLCGQKPGSTGTRPCCRCTRCRRPPKNPRPPSHPCGTGPFFRGTNGSARNRLFESPENLTKITKSIRMNYLSPSTLKGTQLRTQHKWLRPNNHMDNGRFFQFYADRIVLKFVISGGCWIVRCVGVTGYSTLHSSDTLLKLAIIFSGWKVCENIREFDETSQNLPARFAQ